MTAPLILGTNSIKDTGFDVDNSYFIGADAKTSVTNTTPTNTKIFTISFWIKIHEFPTSSGDRPIFGYFSDSNNQAYMYLRNDGTLGIFENESGNTKIDIRTTQVLRDPSAFYNIIMAIDTSQGTAANRLKLYINGSQVSSFAAENYPAQDYASQWNENSLVFHVGGTATNDGNHVKGTFCEFAFIDGQQLDQTSFGQFDTDTPTVFKPISLSTLTFGNNGFLLEFKENGSSANSSGIGADTSGNNRHHSVTNIVATDQRTDTCTNNFATLNPLFVSGSVTLAEGNLKITAIGDNDHMISTLFTTMKFYYEVKVSTAHTGAGGGFAAGATHENAMLTDGFRDGDFDGQERADVKWYTNSNDGKFQEGIGHNVTTGLTRASTDDIVGIAVDPANGKIFIHVNGTYQNSGDPENGTGFIGGTTGSTGLYSPYFTSHLTAGLVEVNFGNPSFSISSGNSDSNSFGNFEFAVPSGYFALCTKNLAEHG